MGNVQPLSFFSWNWCSCQYHLSCFLRAYDSGQKLSSANAWNQTKSNFRQSKGGSWWCNNNVCQKWKLETSPKSFTLYNWNDWFSDIFEGSFEGREVLTMRIICIVILLHMFDIGSRTENFAMLATNQDDFRLWILVKRWKCLFEWCSHGNRETVEILRTIQPNSGDSLWLFDKSFRVSLRRGDCGCKEGESMHISSY